MFESEEIKEKQESPPFTVGRTSILVLALLMVFAAIMGNASLLGCCTNLIRNYTEDYEDLRERHKESYRKLGYALESLEMAKNYNRLIWSVIL